jgi:N-acylneuraminate cytidylyltransferase
MHIVALIPARSGSKGIIHKNIKLYKNKPLIAHSIEIALQSKYINDVYLSTDSNEYANIGIEYGAKIIIRPPEISHDFSPDIDVFKHFLQNIDESYTKIPDIIIHLRPTYPNRSLDLLNKSIEIFIKNYNDYDSLRSVIKIDKTPYKMYFIDNNNNNNNLIPFIKEHPVLQEPYNQARQNFPETYLHNGCIDIIKTSCIIQNNLLSGHKIYPFIMEPSESNDIDTIQDFIISENK